MPGRTPTPGSTPANPGSTQRGTERVGYLLAACLLALWSGGCGARKSKGISGPDFTDVAAAAGIDFVQVSGAYGKKYLPETMGGGCAFLDYDMDGDADVLLTSGKYWRAWHRPAKGPRPTMGLYRNDGHGRFEDVTKQARLDVPFYGLGVAAADYDGDGDPDLLITGIGGNRFFRNDAGTFEDVTEAAGLKGYPDDFNTSAGFFDADGDGDLDLFISNYVLWSMKIDDVLDFRLPKLGRVYGPPLCYESRNSHLYRNEGDGTFLDVSKQAGIEIPNPEGGPVGKALALTFIDVEGDGDLDIYVANDLERNFLFRNRGDGTFEEVGREAGVAFGPSGLATGAMGVDIADIHNDGSLAIGVGNYAGQINSLFVNPPGKLQFKDRAVASGLTMPTRMLVTFGYFFFDYDLDGYQDFFQTNGGITVQGPLLPQPVPYRQPSQLFRNTSVDGKPRFELLDEKRSGALAKAVLGRGASYADIDADGDLDILVAQIDGPALLLRNDQRSGHHWLRVQLVGSGFNREAIGAWVELETEKSTQRRQVMPTRSYCSQVELPVTFGLGALTRVKALRIRWPDGTRQEVPVTDVDRLLVVRKQP